MPMDQFGYNNAFNKHAKFEYKYSFWPRRCHSTKRLLCFTLAMRGRRIITGPGEPVIEDRWYHRDIGIVLLIKKVQEQ
jgi:hypothetical protein